VEAETFAQSAAKFTRGQLLDLLLDVEDRLKSLIRAVFRGHKDDWVTLIPRSVRVELVVAHLDS